MTDVAEWFLTPPELVGQTRFTCVSSDFIDGEDSHAMGCGMVYRRQGFASCDHIVVNGPFAYGVQGRFRTCPDTCGDFVYVASRVSVNRWSAPPLPEHLALINLCDRCRGIIGEDEPSEVVRDRSDNEVEICGDCHDRHVTTCPSCDIDCYSNFMAEVRIDYGQDTVDVCYPCINGDRGRYDIVMCSHCDRYMDSNEACCEPSEEGYVADCQCGECDDAVRRNSVVHDYGYKPRPVFHRVEGEPIVERLNRFRESYDATLYMGMELEVESLERNSDVEVQNALGDVVYLKEDSSINDGFEIVTHPMTFRYAMESFNWNGIRDLRSDRRIGTSSNCGIHIHASKNAFTGPPHEYRWIMFWHRNQVNLKKLAGRDSSYGSYDNDQRAKLVNVVKKGDHSYRRSAINTQNEYTHEVRVFASTLYVNRIKAAFQLVEGTIEYTRSLAAAKVMKDGGYSWVEFIVWLRSCGTKYAQLIKRIEDLDINCEPDYQTESAGVRWDESRNLYTDRKFRVIQEGRKA
jgi:hypothetical protein